MTFYILSSSLISNMNKIEKPNKINGIKDLNIDNFLSLILFSTNYCKNYISQIITAFVCICIFFKG